jgi:hypothetical protein
MVSQMSRSTYSIFWVLTYELSIYFLGTSALAYHNADRAYDIALPVKQGTGTGWRNEEGGYYDLLLVKDFGIPMTQLSHFYIKIIQLPILDVSHWRLRSCLEIASPQILALRRIRIKFRSGPGSPGIVSQLFTISFVDVTNQPAPFQNSDISFGQPVGHLIIHLLLFRLGYLASWIKISVGELEKGRYPCISIRPSGPCP